MDRKGTLDCEAVKRYVKSTDFQVLPGLHPGLLHGVVFLGRTLRFFSTSLHPGAYMAVNVICQNTEVGVDSDKLKSYLDMLQYVYNKNALCYRNQS